MASSYTTNSGIEKPATGEQSGTWGATVNTNMDILDTIVSGFVQITASSTSETLTTTDGTVTNGMNRAIKYVDGGDLGGNCTVTISPNDQEKLIFVENGLSASRTLIFSQGSGANFTLQNGKQAIIKSDGAGSGAAVAGVYANIQISTLECEGAAAIDGAATLGSTLAVTGAITASGGVAATGNVTATGTVEPAGDTSASDNAAFGYTSVLGAIITGQGSTNDVTLVNDADATVLGIATGTTNVDVVGDITAANFQPDGDTAASDTAAFGYTSVLGAIITGQGSTNDVTLVNDADATVLGIPTGTTNVDVVGDLTAGTLNADGDTAASDNAAIGYTAAEGIIITGQGSTNDVTIKNDADADVIEIPTGGTDVTVAGKLTAGKILLGNTDTDTSNTGSVTLDYSANQNFVLTFTGNVTLANPSTEAVGQAGVIVCIQDGTGSRTLSLGSQYKTVGDAGITLSTAANSVDIIPYFVSADASILIGAVQLALSGA
jgi:hypothetical protein